MSDLLVGLTSEDMREQLARLRDADPTQRVLGWLLEPARDLDWAHTVGVVTDPGLAACVPPLPPLALRLICAEPDPAMFLYTGIVDLRGLLALHDRYAKRVEGPARVLDFGCGCGRLTRFLDPARWDVNAVDVNPDQVAWCRANLPHVETLETGCAPPLPFEEGAFDFVYSLSIFSHLAPAMVDRWLAELARVTASGGILAVTFLGPRGLDVIAGSDGHQAATHLPAAEVPAVREALRATGAVLRPYPEGETERIGVATDEYGITFLDPAWAREAAERAGLTVLEHVVGGIRGFQDVLVVSR